MNLRPAGPLQMQRAGRRYFGYTSVLSSDLDFITRS